MLQPKVTTVKPLPDYKLLLDSETGERKIFDVMPYIRGDWYGKLHDVDVFRTVHVAGISIAWEDGQDIAPHELYDDSVPAVCALESIGLSTVICKEKAVRLISTSEVLVHAVGFTNKEGDCHDRTGTGNFDDV